MIRRLRRAALPGVGRLARSRSLPAVVLGVVAMAVLAAVVVASATGEANTPGVIDGAPRLIAESFASPDGLDPNGEFQWATGDGSWSLTGSALVAVEVPARLDSGRELPPSYRLGVSWEGSADGAQVVLHWADGDRWEFRAGADRFEFVHRTGDEETVIADGPLPGAASSRPGVLLTRTADSVTAELTGSSIEDRRRVASVDRLDPPTDHQFSIGADTAGVRFARIELELST